MGLYIIADNQELTAFALESLLVGEEQNVVRRAADKQELMEQLLEWRREAEQPPAPAERERAVVLLDYTLFDFQDEEQLLVMSERFADVSWVLLSEELTADFLRKMIYSSQAFSVVFKDQPMLMVSAAVQYARSGRRYICQRATEMVLSRHETEHPDTLTPTEVQIVKAIAQGKTTKEIAAERFLSVHTVNTHRKNIFRKLGVNTAHEAVKYAIRAGWVDPTEFYI